MTKGELTLSRPQYYRDYGKIHGHLGTEIMRNKTFPQKSVKSIYIWSLCKICVYSRERKYRHPNYRGIMFSQFPPSFRKYSVTNDTSFESPNIELLESGKKLGMALSWGWPRPLNWKSTTFTKTRLEPLMADFLPVSNLLSNSGL